MSVDLEGPTGSLTPAFCRRLRHRVAMLAIFSVAAFGFVLDRVLRDDARRRLTDQAHIYASALDPGPGGDLSHSTQMLLSRSENLVAIATLNSAGNLKAVYPERVAHRSAANRILTDPGAIVRIAGPQDGNPISAVGLTVSLNGDSSTAARKVLILLRDDSYRARWMRTTGLFALLVGVFALVTIRSMRQWFEESITGPLQIMVQAVRNPDLHPNPSRWSRSRGWSETSEIGRVFEDLLAAMAVSEARVQEVEREMMQKIRKHQQGFDRELRRARDQATMDELTGLRNRSFLSSMLEPLYVMQKKQKQNLAVVMIDMDNFKQYNDNHGHLVGDALLRFVGSLLKSAVRPSDHAVRFGGDEFLLLLPDTDAKEAAAVTERVVKLFRQYVSRLGPQQDLSMSAGIATLFAQESGTGEGLIELADAALYQAKRNGKNGVVVSQAA